jgi:3-dehydroquinate dehydratase-2
VANGPNLNLLGSREPEVYGHRTLAQLEDEVRAHAERLGCEVEFFQTNHEGELIDRLQAATADAIILNGAALTHYSHALYDCLKAISKPVVEVHISNLFARPEAHRKVSVTAPACVGVVTGLGFKGYLLAMEYLVDKHE